MNQVVKIQGNEEIWRENVITSLCSIWRSAVCDPPSNTEYCEICKHLEDVVMAWVWLTGIHKSKKMAKRLNTHQTWLCWGENETIIYSIISHWWSQQIDGSRWARGWWVWLICVNNMGGNTGIRRDVLRWLVALNLSFPIKNIKR